MKRYRNWIIAFVLSATAGAIALQNGLAPSSTETAPVTSTSTIKSTDTPTSTPTYEPCGYVWAYQDVPELSIKIETAIHALNPDATIRAQAFGENCVYADGRTSFGAMETDLYIHIPVEDLSNEEILGNWMAQVLPLIVQVSEAEFPGGYGFVEFWFEKSATEFKIAKVQVTEYLDAEVQKKSGAELFHLFYDKP